jgi:polysaccharide lyase-like protein
MATNARLSLVLLALAWAGLTASLTAAASASARSADTRLAGGATHSASRGSVASVRKSRAAATSPGQALMFATRRGRLTEPWLPYPAQSALVSALGSSTGSGVLLRTMATSGGLNESSEMSALYVNPQYAGAGWSRTTNARVQDQSTWYHVRMKLPSDSYQPTTGQWNWLVEWHDDPHTAPSGDGPYSIALGIYTDYPVVSGAVGMHPRLVLRMAGGRATDPTYQNLFAPGLVRYDQWYGLTFHFIWSTKATVGAVQWLVDGQRVASEHFATLYTNPDGNASYNSFGVYNYHLACPWQSTVEFEDLAIGPTFASVGS